MKNKQKSQANFLEMYFLEDEDYLGERSLQTMMSTSCVLKRVPIKTQVLPCIIFKHIEKQIFSNFLRSKLV